MTEDPAPPRSAAPRSVPPPAVRGLTVLYDADCPLCAFLRGWLSRQPQLVPLDFVPAGSEQARRRFPALDHGSTLVDITVVADGGQVYRAANAWVVCLWALAEYRPTAHRLSSPKGAKLAKGAVIAASKYREALFAQRARAGGGGAGRRGARRAHHSVRPQGQAGGDAGGRGGGAG
ncbi:thiol-disulfide oxidoreductase DCC family protein, partial [Streptomyces sp. NPDC127068]|uniref:thiol-disulfide oxidoreductase DCC family protein n=1 Tax=Streptomyces sp. NPDC127068 TaxID=3347127 RepID=UPI0036522F6E